MLYAFHKTAATVSSLAENKPTETRAGTKPVCVLKRGEKVYAFAALCPHSGAPMCDGWVDGMGRIVCPLHKYRFDPANGRNTSGEGYKMVTFPVEARDGVVYVGLLEEGQDNKSLTKQAGIIPPKDLDDDVERW